MLKSPGHGVQVRAYGQQTPGQRDARFLPGSCPRSHSLEVGEVSFLWTLAVPGCVGAARVLSTWDRIEVVRSGGHLQI